MTKKPSGDKSSWKGVAPYLDLGLQMALAVGLGAGVGYFLDQKLSTTPLFFLLGLALGATSGFLTLYRAVYSSDRRKSHNNSDE
jgi:F0F1-type ATP synthase assembly protein I